MSQYLLSTYAVEGEPSPEPPPSEEMQAMMSRIIALEAEMEATGTFVFGGHLCGPDAATVVRMNNTELIMKWNRRMIDEGHAIVRDCIRRGRPGPFQLQAAIQAVHCSAETFEATDWDQIVTLYDHLYSVMPSPVVALNRAIAIAEIRGPEVGLTALDVVGRELANYYPLHAARASMLRRLGRPHAACVAYERAAQLATSQPDRDYFEAQLCELSNRDGQ